MEVCVFQFTFKPNLLFIHYKCDNGKNSIKRRKNLCNQPVETVVESSGLIGQPRIQLGGIVILVSICALGTPTPVRRE